MPTCTHISYHMEAQRKARALLRKQEAMLRQLLLQEENEKRELEEQKRVEEEKARAEENKKRQREEHLRQRGQMGKDRGTRQKQGWDHNNRRCHSTGSIYTQKDLRHQHKILRDHGLVMGNVNTAFHS